MFSYSIGGLMIAIAMFLMVACGYLAFETQNMTYGYGSVLGFFGVMMGIFILFDNTGEVLKNE